MKCQCKTKSVNVRIEEHMVKNIDSVGVVDIFSKYKEHLDDILF